MNWHEWSSLKYCVESFSGVSSLITLIRYRKYPLCCSPGIHEVARLNVAILFAGRKGAILTGFHSLVWDRDEFGLDGADGFWVWQKSGLAVSKRSNRLRFMGHLILPSDSHIASQPITLLATSRSYRQPSSSSHPVRRSGLRGSRSRSWVRSASSDRP